MDTVLAYGSNLMPATSVGELTGGTVPFFRDVRERLGWPRLGLDLHLEAGVIAACREDPDQIDAIRRALGEAGLGVASINAFPFHSFQSGPVKDRAYEPSWLRRERLELTCAAMDLAAVLCEDAIVSVSTSPGSYLPWGEQANDVKAIAVGFGRAAAHALQLSQRCGKRVILCPEPEPQCTLSTVAQSVRFWGYPIPAFARPAASEILDHDEAAARTAIAEHLGLCLDTCHLAVEFEDPTAAHTRLREVGAAPVKLQLSACPEVHEPGRDRDAVRALRAMAEPRFLHQTTWRNRDGSLTRLRDLDALDPADPALDAADCLRTHFHIPIHRPPQTPGIGSTIDAALAALPGMCAAQPCQLCVETYTWSVLAGDHADRSAGVAAELAFLAEALSTR